MDLAEVLHFRMNKPLAKPRRRHRHHGARLRPMGAKPVDLDLTDDITKKIDVLIKKVEEAVKSKPFFQNHLVELQSSLAGGVER